MRRRVLIDDLNDILVRKPEVWEGLRGASLFISGGTGWFGRWLLEAIAFANARLDAGITVMALSRNPSAFARLAPHLANNSAIRFHRGDVRDFDFPDQYFSHFIHAATTSAHETFQGEAPLDKFDTLVAGSRRVLDFAAKVQPAHFLFTSSGAAYGPSSLGRPWCEEDLLAPDTTDHLSALGQAKRSAEFLCSAYAHQHGWSLTIARCFAFVGPFMPLDIHYAIGNFMRCAQKNEPIIINGDGSPVRSYLYMADLVVWLLAALQRKGAPTIFNVGSDEAVTIAELAGRVRDWVNPASEINILGRDNASIGNPARNLYVPDIRRAKECLGLAPWTSLDKAIQYTLAALQHS